jgi:uncharacterized protein (DUF433 family)
MAESKSILNRYGEVSMNQAGGIGSFIVLTPEIGSGRARIAGTGVTVRRVVGWYKAGLSPEEIVNEIGHLNLAQVFAALTYYHANRQEIETDIELENDQVERLEGKQPSVNDFSS